MKRSTWLNLESDSTVLVTGASGGIGKEISHALLDLGIKVIGLSRSSKNLDSLTNNENFTSLKFDAEDTESFKPLVKSISKLNGIIFAHGINYKMPLHMVTKKGLNHLIDVNFESIALLIGEIVKRRKILNNSSIVMISSISAYAGVKGMSFYAATKAGLNGYVRGIADELAPKNIRVNSISPYVVLTPLWENEDGNIEWALDKYKGIPMGPGKPEDVAAAALFFLSKQSQYITGQSIRMDGLETWIH